MDETQPHQPEDMPFLDLEAMTKQTRSWQDVEKVEERQIGPWPTIELKSRFRSGATEEDNLRAAGTRSG